MFKTIKEIAKLTRWISDDIEEFVILNVDVIMVLWLQFFLKGLYLLEKSAEIFANKI